MRGARSIALGLAAAALALAGAASADWLVTRDGARVEIRGPWEVRGKQVIFTLPNGTLSSMPLSEVDLDGSAELTAASKAPAPKPRQARPRAVWTIGQDDVPPARPPQPPPAAADETTAAEANGAATDERPTPFLEGLQVISWEKVERPLIGAFEVTGLIHNANRSVAAEVVVTVRLLDDNGATVASGRAFLDAHAVAGGQSLRFRRIFQDVRDFATAEFEVSAIEVLLGASPGAAATRP